MTVFAITGNYSVCPLMKIMLLSDPIFPLFRTNPATIIPKCPVKFIPIRARQWFPKPGPKRDGRLKAIRHADDTDLTDLCRLFF
jgi:hypothetical protein